MGKTRTKPLEEKNAAGAAVKPKVGKAGNVAAATATPDGASSSGKAAKRTALSNGCFYVTSNFNNTLVTFTDQQGNVLAQSSAGRAGFRNTKKGTPYAGAKAMELLIDKASQYDIREVRVVIRGIGPGRESAIRALFNANLNIVTIEDRTPVAFGGSKPRRPRRV